MKKALLSLSVLVLTACSIGGGVPAEIKKAVAEQKNSININEVTNFAWEGLNILRPYQQKTILGENFNNEGDTSCIWIFHDGETVVQSFEIAREDVECIKLPSKVFTPAEAIFLIDENVLKERKRFQLPSRS